MKACIYTLGCKVNAYESEFVRSMLEDKGYEIVEFGEDSDVVIINTCSVTNNSDSKSKKMINQAIKKYPTSCIVAMGCFIEANHDIQIDGVDILLGNKDKSRLPELLDEFFERKEQIKDFYTYDKLGEVFENMEISSFKGKTRAFVKIQDGCENFCTYCIIPYVRGKCRSKNKNEVIREITNLVKNGYKEIVLTGIHTGNYGVDLNTNFAALLEEVIKIPDLYRIRISSIEITELNEKVLNILKNSKIIANHLHIPLQAGSNHVLKLMNRKYDLNYFREKINEIRSIRPEISISTDVIVGFPEETEEDFKSTLDFCKEIEFSKIHVFPYSPRKNTPAAKFKNQIDGKIKKRRAHELIELSQKLENDYMKKNIGKTLECLIEENDSEYSYGHTSNYLHVKVKGKYESEEIIDVEIDSVNYPYVLAKTKEKINS